MSFSDTSPAYVITPSVDGPPTPSVVRRNQTFYLRTVVFKAGDELFNLPRFSLPEQSKFFDDIYAGTGGTSDTDPVLLENAVTAEEFHSLLKLTFRVPKLTIGQALSVDDWMSVLKLAKIWSISPLREQAVTVLGTMIKGKSSIEKVLLARRYDVAQWLTDGLTLLAAQREPISATIRDSLGWETYGRVMEIRERWRQEAWTKVQAASTCSQNQASWSDCIVCRSQDYPGVVHCMKLDIAFYQGHSFLGKPRAQPQSWTKPLPDLHELLSSTKCSTFEVMIAHEFKEELERMKGGTV
ncbi:hypothetical protein PENSPDRAFT_684027 [Peniophora sp. CONT]|nr:hypothetical protein PENSPDRAFT_684027 [Peniophora sp. CONT]